ncbi:hypothetical protein BDN72DRAFT_956263 [Pluteus cervinus]|uniref:Uncharacterized protein n=1 Tax=Pluteus cervinus TaxID=181527 RepID=A0ACD3B6I7_9AGAR|nr:hypothetical protein BDN72DRAFT_956263 [Pluteus cervinus]
MSNMLLYTQSYRSSSRHESPAHSLWVGEEVHRKVTYVDPSGRYGSLPVFSPVVGQGNRLNTTRGIIDTLKQSFFSAVRKVQLSVTTEESHYRWLHPEDRLSANAELDQPLVQSPTDINDISLAPHQPEYAQSSATLNSAAASTQLGTLTPAGAQLSEEPATRPPSYSFHVYPAPVQPRQPVRQVALRPGESSRTQSRRSSRRVRTSRTSLDRLSVEIRAIEADETITKWAMGSLLALAVLAFLSTCVVDKKP